MYPCALARLKPEARAKKQKSKFNSLLHALRNALDMALETGSTASTGWPMWWLENVVLEFSARPDGVSVCDALADGALPAFRYHQRTRLDSLRLLQTSPCEFSHFGSHLPSVAECTAHTLASVLEFVWPLAVKCVIKYKGRVLAVCSEDGILWIADTGCGYHLVPEGDVERGKSLVVPNPGAQRLHTANGEIDASECVNFTLDEVGLSKRLATILPETPRVLSVGALCVDERATFVWPAGGTPYFTLSCGRVVYCEVHGRVPYLRTGSFSSHAGPRGSAAMPMVAASSNNAPLCARPALPLTAPPPAVSMKEAPVARHKVLQPALAVPSGAAGALPPALPDAGVNDVPAPPFDEDEPLAADPLPAAGEEAPPADPLAADPVAEAAVPPIGPLDADAVAEGVPPVPDDEHAVRARKAEATSLRHLLTHHPKNVYCNTCCIAKCQRFPHRRKHHRYWKGKPAPLKFGDQVTADHIVAYSENSMGVTGDQAAVVFGDRATGYFDGFPLKGKTTPDTSHALRCSAGSERIARAWSDNSPELIATMIENKVVHDLGTQGQPQTNGRAERLVRRTMEGTKTLLLQAGLPGAFWPYAMKAYCFAQNTEVIKGDSAWNQRHGLGHFDGPRIPFGCLVDF